MLSSRSLCRVGIALGVCLLASPALATLTDSEKAQIRDFYAKGDSATAGRVRALLARPDLTPPEAGAAFAEAARRVPFDDAHSAFVKEMLFGPASAPSRSELVQAVVSGLLARSAETLAAAAQNEGRAEELTRIHGFVAREIASAGKPPQDGHDASAAIRDDALRAAAAAYKTHLALPAFDRARVTGALKSARAQAELALIELASGLHAAPDVAAWIGADPAERAAFEHTGVLVVGLADAPGAKAANVVQMLDTVGLASRNASALWIGKPRPRGLRARRGVLVAQAPLAGTRRLEPSRLWSSSVEPSSPDAALAEIAFTLGRAATAQLIEDNSHFASTVDAALERARAAGEAAFLVPGALSEGLDHDKAGPAAAMSAASFVGHGVELLLLDAPRALSAALARTLVGRFEPLEQLTLALGVLARAPDGTMRESLTLGRQGEGGGIVTVPVTSIRGTPSRIDELVLEGQGIKLTHAADGSVTRVERAGKPVTLSTIPFARIPTVGGETWTHTFDKDPKKASEPLTLKRLLGRPEVGFVDDGRVIVRSVGKGRDAVVAKGPTGDAEVELDLRCVVAPCAVLLRASAGTTGYAGAALILEPGDAPRASFVALDGAGGKFPLGSGPVTLGKPGPRGHHVKVVIEGDRVEFRIADKSLATPLPTFLIAAPGDVVFAPGERGEMFFSTLRVAARTKKIAR